MTTNENNNVPQLHEISAQVSKAMETARSIDYQGQDDLYIGLVIERVKPALKDQNLIQPMLVKDETGYVMRGVFLFKEDKRFSTAEIWIDDRGYVYEYYRDSKDLRKLEFKDIIGEIGLEKFAKGVITAFSEIEKIKARIATTHEQGKKLVDSIVRIGPR